jgi:hypothetical protein
MEVLVILSRHAQARKCQRSVPSFVVSAAYEFGTPCNVRGVAQSYTLDREAIDLAGDCYPRPVLASLNRYVGVYVVVGECGKIITVARGNARFIRH